MLYADFVDEVDFQELLGLLQTRFKSIQYGQQGDSWIWIKEDGMKVEIDTFTHMLFQVKSPSANNSLVYEVISLLKEKYQITVLDSPELEPHEC